MHVSQKILKASLTDAAKKVKVGGCYTHYKNPDDVYKVVGLAITEQDDTVCVIYEAQYGEKLVFVRPLDSWLEKVAWHDGLVDRFKPQACEK